MTPTDAAASIDLQTMAYTAAAIRAAEKPLLEAGAPLMARAARAVADAVHGELEVAAGAIASSPDGRDALRTVLVLAGRGDNGGDALFAAAHLADEGCLVDVLLTADGAHGEALTAARRAGARCIGLDDIRDGGAAHRVVVDGILGIGTSENPALRGVARAAVKAVRATAEDESSPSPRIVAVDVPSGVHPDDGTSDGLVLPATVTMAFGALKAGLLRGDGPRFAGRVRVVDIGLAPLLARVRPAGRARDAVEVVDASRAERAGAPVAGQRA